MNLDGEMMIDLAKDFNPYPAGRTEDDGAYNGTRFRDTVLIPALRELAPGEQIVVDIDGVRAFGSSFLEEAFAGLVRKRIITRQEAIKLIKIQTSKPQLEFFKDAIIRLLEEAHPA